MAKLTPETEATHPCCLVPPGARRSAGRMTSAFGNLRRSDRPKHRRASLRASVSSDEWH